jgi:hypothetical protein
LRCCGEEFTSGDSKKEILRIYLKLVGLSAAKEILKESLALDRRYTEEVGRQMLQKSKKTYKAILGEFETFIPKALEFARINLFFIDKH